MFRPVTPQDRPILAVMFAEFYASSAVLHPIPAEYHEAALDDLFREGSTQRCLIAEQDGRAVGYGLLSLKYSHEAGGPELWAEELYLREGHRGCGLGSEFFRLLPALARREGCRRIRLEVEPGNVRARALYLRCGYTALGYDQMVTAL